ncbi:MAG: PQQ-binding-like beta-propeller repeat protein [Planctomycetota bacterium]
MRFLLTSLIACCAPASAQQVFPRADAAIPIAAQPERTAAPASPRGTWTHLAGDADRDARPIAPGPFDAAAFAPLWTASTDTLGRPIEWIGPSGVVTDGSLVFGVALIDFNDHAVAVDARTGDVRWTTPIPIALLDSWSTPALDTGNNAVLYAAGSNLTALDARTGATRWQADLAANIVNASPVVTTDQHPADRAFITDFATSANGRLICINVDPFHPALNPHQPGDILWSAPLPGPTSGNSPAVRGAIVYAATAGGPTTDRPDAGRLVAFDARATTQPAPLWTATNPTDTGFFGGVVATPGALLASTYAFAPGQFAATTIALDRFTGDTLWSAATNRTNAVPLPLADGSVLVSAGLPDDPFFPPFGTVPSIQRIEPDAAEPTGARVAWDSAQATLADTNANGAVDPGESFTPLGGWTVQPARVRTLGRDLVLVGTIAESFAGSFFDAPVRLSLIDPALDPADPGFVIATIEDAGGAPAVIASTVYTIAPQGLRAIRLAPAQTTRQTTRRPAP